MRNRTDWHLFRSLPEDHLGVQPMIRASRSVRLTPVGASFAAELRDVLERFAAATSAATGQTSGIVSVSTIDSFTARWLMPRLFRFRRVHGDIDVRVAIAERLADFVSDGIDIAIRCGGGQYPGLSAELLMKEDHFPVCSPQLLKGRHLLRTPADLARHTLLHDVFTVDWAIWLHSAGIDNVDPHRGPTFLSSDHAIQAAVRGEGVVLGRSALARRHRGTGWVATTPNPTVLSPKTGGRCGNSARRDLRAGLSNAHPYRDKSLPSRRRGMRNCTDWRFSPPC